MPLAGISSVASPPTTTTSSPPTTSSPLLRTRSLQPSERDGPPTRTDMNRTPTPMMAKSSSSTLSRQPFATMTGSSVRGPLLSGGGGYDEYDKFSDPLGALRGGNSD
jgi:hypothetical protein